MQIGGPSKRSNNILFLQNNTVERKTIINRTKIRPREINVSASEGRIVALIRVDIKIHVEMGKPFASALFSVRALPILNRLFNDFHTTLTFLELKIYRYIVKLFFKSLYSKDIINIVSTFVKQNIQIFFGTVVIAEIKI